MMKKIFLILIFCCLIYTASLAQQTPWQFVNPVPQGNLLNGIWAINKDTAFAIGNYGTIIKTTNRGTTWSVSQAVNGIYENLSAIKFISNTIGWIVGEAGTILKTINGGDEWFPADSPSYTNFNTIDFASDSVGWIAGSGGTIYKTTNAGAIWIKQTTGITSVINTIQFLNSSTGFAAGHYGRLLKTTNGGTNWIKDSISTQTIFSLQFITSSIGFAVGTGGTVFKTINGGSTWVPQLSGTTVTLFNVQFVNSMTGWISGSFGTIRKTTNGGINWFPQTIDTYNDIYGMYFISSTTGWVVGDYGTIVATTNGGSAWQNQSSGPKNDIYAMSFPTTSVGYVVGDEGAVSKTTNSGIAWIKQPSGYYLPLYGVYFVSSSLGWAVGDSAIIIKTTNGGATWNNQNSRNDITLNSVFFTNADVGWAVGDDGTILRTGSGGALWLPQVSPTSSSLLRVQFINELIGWAVGYSGVVLKTTDGGNTWMKKNSGTGQVLYSLCFVDQNNGYAVGDYGVIISTTDGGENWNLLNTNSDASFYGVTFSNRTTGWAVGDDGAIINTTNAGSSWNLQRSGTENTLFDTRFISTASGGVIFAGGIGGTIMCSGISPFPTRIWTGVYDSLWSSAANWNPTGVPDKIDSVIIPSTSVKPVIRQNTQQINIAGLRISAGAKLTIGPELAQMIVKSNIDIAGILEITSVATPQLILGGSVIVGTNGKFYPGKSTIAFTGNGLLKGSFYNIVVKESACVRTIGNVEIQNNLMNLSNFSLRSNDTLTIKNPDPYALTNLGTFGAGTIKRFISQNTSASYQFESPVTYIRFHQTGIKPDSILVTTYPNTLAPGIQESIYVKRYYSIKPFGGSNYLAYLSLRYDTSETKIPIDELALFRDSSGVIINMGQADFLDSDLVAISTDSVHGFSNWYLGYMEHYPRHPFEFMDSLFVSDNGSGIDTLIFGAAPGATDGLDTTFGESQLNPKPPSGTFDVRWSIPSTLGTKTNIQDVFRDGNQENIYTCSLQSGSGGFPFSIQWDNMHLPIGSMFIRDSITQGGQFNVNMKTQSSISITNPSIDKIQIVHSRPYYYSFNKRWNMISLPLLTTNRSKTNIFPTSISFAYKYTNGYFREDTLTNGRGYWLKFPVAQNIAMEGFPYYIDTIEVERGWNMIGSLSSSVAVNNISSIPSGIIAGSCYGYSGSYFQTDSIRPSKGYWIKVSNSGLLILSSQAMNKLTNEKSFTNRLEKFNKLAITDNNGSEQILYFGKNDDPEFNLDDYEMPPKAPIGIFDARYSSNRILDILTKDNPSTIIEIQSAEYPVTIKWQFVQNQTQLVMLTDAVTGKILHNSLYDNSESFSIFNPNIKKIILTTNTQSSLPKDFVLKQNYPNPFNPITNIEFEIPVQSTVTIRIFNTIGQEIISPIYNKTYSAGSYSVPFDGSNHGTGIYFYQMIAKSRDNRIFQQVKKMILIK